VGGCLPTAADSVKLCGESSSYACKRLKKRAKNRAEGIICQLR